MPTSRGATRMPDHCAATRSSPSRSCGFGVWASTAPIAGAIVASGVFVATGQNKIVQHLEGGVIRDILVREGDIVERRPALIHLDETVPKAELRRLTLAALRLVAIEARLQAEMRDDKRGRASRTSCAQKVSRPGRQDDPRKPAAHLRGAAQQPQERDRHHPGGHRRPSRSASTARKTQLAGVQAPAVLHRRGTRGQERASARAA